MYFDQHFADQSLDIIFTPTLTNTKASKLAEIHEIYAYAMEARDHIMTALNEINQLERRTVTSYSLTMLMFNHAIV